MLDRTSRHARLQADRMPCASQLMNEPDRTGKRSSSRGLDDRVNPRRNHHGQLGLLDAIELAPLDRGRLGKIGSMSAQFGAPESTRFSLRARRLLALSWARLLRLGLFVGNS
jgi:hypothetical protein